MLRRGFLLTGLAMAGCGRAPPRARGLDTTLLDEAFSELAARGQPGQLNAGVMNLATNAYWFWNADAPMPMQSVFKLILGAFVLDRAQAGKLDLAGRVTLKETDLSPPFSPIAAQFPVKTEYAWSELLEAAVVASDNTAADVLMKAVGGPGALTGWLQVKRIEGIRVDRYERQMQPEALGMPPFRPEWAKPEAFTAARLAVPPAEQRAALDHHLADLRDTSTLEGMIDFLCRIARRQLLSAEASERLLAMLRRFRRGAERLRAGLPEGATLVHRTGSSGVILGVAPATNDVGLVTLRNGREYAVAVFLKASTAPEAARDALIADASRLIARAVK